MQNVQKYFIILETLRYGETAIDDDSNLKPNLEILKKYIKCDDLQVHEILSSSIRKSNNSEESWTYACYLQHVILTVIPNVDLDSTEKENLISVRQQNELFNAIKLASRYGIVYNLPALLQQHQVFRGRTGNSGDEERLKISLKVLSKVFSTATIASTRSMDSVVLEMMAGIYSSTDPEVVSILDKLWEYTAKENYFRYLLILKAITAPNSQMQEAIHKDLLKKLTEPGGFKLLVLNTVPSVHGSTEIPNWKRYEIVASIIAHKGHTASFNKQMIAQIFSFIQNSMFDVVESSLIPAAVVTLRKLYLLKNGTRTEIDRIIQQFYKPFIEPDDIIAGLVVMEASELQAFVKLQCLLFNGSSFEALPSTALVRYLPVLISMHALTEGTDLTKDLITLISQCLANRKPEELRTVMKSLFDKQHNELQLQFLHDRVGIRKVDQSQGQLQIVPQDFENSIDLPSALIRVLKGSNNNILTYNCFIQILMIFDETESSSECTDAEREISLLQSEQELDVYLSRKFQTRISVISCLTELTAFRQFHSQFHENPADVLEFLQNALQKRLDGNRENFDSDENLPVLLAVFQEFIENIKNCEKYQGIRNSLKTYLQRVTRNELRHQIQTIITTLEGGSRSTGLESSDYDFARSLMAESQSHLRVYGISQFIRLLTKRDEETISNRHTILAMAMHALRDEESYTYLNCIRLFVCLMNSMQAEVLEALSAEYLNEAENIEFRLKVGEAILKVTEELGPISYNYKEVLVSCFLNGAGNPINEFRSSSMSNLATLCRLLSYQVHHFFNEMMLLIESTLQTDTYLPTRRAAVLVLSQLLWGMDNLVDFQETLLPIYRLLKTIVENDKDEKTRIHATNGLQYLKDKCKAFLFPEQKMEKEIQIFGIKDNDGGKKKKTAHILEL